MVQLPLDHIPPRTSQLPPMSRMGLLGIPLFVGREHDLSRLAVAMIDPSPTILTPAVATGIGGIGKTSLAVEFAYRYWTRTLHRLMRPFGDQADVGMIPGTLICWSFHGSRCLVDSRCHGASHRALDG